MSNASNLSTLANVLDDGSDGQFLKSTGSGGVAFDTVAAGATVYSSASDLPLTGNTVGDMAYVSAATTAKVVNQTTGSVSTEDATRLYIYSGTGWYSVAFITQNPTISTVQDAGGGSTPFTLATDGTTATVVTITANDPESVPLTYSYSVTSGSLNGCTITGADGTSARVAGTAYTDNVFTVTPHASNEATFTLTFTASDGINQATSANEFSLSFVTIVTDSNHTTLLATATGTSDNNNITDSSSNSHSITVNGDAHAGTFSPYRSGGYSTYFNYASYGSSSIGLRPKSTTEPSYGGSGDLTVELWIYPTIESNNNFTCLLDQRPYGSNGNYVMLRRDSDGTIRFHWDFGFRINTSSNAAPANEWTHIAIVRSSGVFTMYINGTAETTTYTNSGSNTNSSGSLSPYIGLQRDGNGPFWGYIRDLRFVSSSVYTQNFTPLEKLTAITGTTFLTCHKTYQLVYDTDSTTNVKMETYSSPVEAGSISPYDYEEYSAADHGGSVYFDGTGDTLEIPHSTNVGAFGTNDFTVQMWYYTDAVGNQDYLIDFRQYGGNGDYLSISKNGSNKIVVAEGGSNRITGTKDISVGQWFFITVHRDNGSLKLFVNGEQDGSTYSDSTNYVAGSSGNFIIGKNNGSASYFMEGYLSDIKVTHGSALGGTTVPTAPLSSSGAVLHIKGTDASIIDKSQRYNINLGSTSIVGHSTTKWSGANSIYINSMSNNSDLITLPAGVLNASKPFTIEMWLRTNSGSASGFWSIHKGSGNTMRLKMRTDDRLEFYHIGSNAAAQEIKDETNTYLLNNTDFYHVAITRDANSVFYLHQNGIKLGNFTSNGDYDSSDTAFIIGKSQPATERYMNGYIQDFRITQGLARYTANDESSNIPSAPLEG